MPVSRDHQLDRSGWVQVDLAQTVQGGCLTVLSEARVRHQPFALARVDGNALPVSGPEQRDFRLVTRGPGWLIQHPTLPATSRPTRAPLRYLAPSVGEGRGTRSATLCGERPPTDLSYPITQQETAPSRIRLRSSAHFLQRNGGDLAVPFVTGSQVEQPRLELVVMNLGDLSLPFRGRVKGWSGNPRNSWSQNAESTSVGRPQGHLGISVRGCPVLVTGEAIGGQGRRNEACRCPERPDVVRGGRPCGGRRLLG